MALPQTGVSLVAQGAQTFQASLTAANNVLGVFGNTAKTASSTFTGAMGAIGGALSPLGNLFDRVLNQVFITTIRRATRAVLDFIGSLAQAAVEGSPLENSLGRLSASLDQVTKTSFAPLVAEISGLVDKAAPSFLGILQAAETYLGGLGQNALAWGGNLVTQFAQGMIDALGSVLAALTEIANMVTYFLAPGSPPRLLPDIDTWGADTATEWLKGWTKTDFSVFDGLTGTLESLIRSIPIPKGDQAGVVPQILGAREGIARAVEELRTAGAVSQETLDKIIASVGTASTSVRDYILATINLQAANAAVKAAQDELTAATKKYQDLLKPVDDALAGLTEEQQQLADAQKASLLQLVLQDPNATPEQKRNAQLELQRIQLEKNRRALLAEQKAAVDGAQDKLDAAKKAQAKAQDEFDARKALIAVETEQNNLLKEQLRLLESLAKAQAAAPKPKAGGGATFAPFAVKPFHLEDLIPPDLIAKWGAFTAALGAAWDAIAIKFQPTIDAINQHLIPAIQGLLKAFEDSRPKIEAVIADLVAFTVKQFGDVLPTTIDNLAQSINTLTTFWKNHGDTVLAILDFLGRTIITTFAVSLLVVSGIISAGLTIIEGFFDATSKLISGDWKEAWRLISVATVQAVLTLLNTINTALEAIAGIVNLDLGKIQESWTGTWDLIGDVAVIFLNGIVKLFGDKLHELHVNIDTALGFIKGVFSGVMFGITQDIQPVIDAINGILTAAQNLFNWLATHVFNFQIPDIPGVSTNGTNSVSRPIAPAYGASSSSVSYGAPSFTYAPTYNSAPPSPEASFARMAAMYG